MSDIVERFEEAKRELITEALLKDVFDGIEHLFGKEGLDQVANFALMRSRARCDEWMAPATASSPADSVPAQRPPE